MVSHVYYIAAGQGRLLAYLGVCEQCAGEFVVEPMDYPELVKSKHSHPIGLVYSEK
jgi:hypothetical protein